MQLVIHRDWTMEHPHCHLGPGLHLVSRGSLLRKNIMAVWTEQPVGETGEEARK